MPDITGVDVAALKAAEERAYTLCDQASALVDALFRLVTSEHQGRARYRRAFDDAAARAQRRHDAWLRAWHAWENAKIAGNGRPQVRNQQGGKS